MISHAFPVRCSVFSRGTLDALPLGPRKRGRPRQTWHDNIFNVATQVAGTHDRLSAFLAPSAQAERAWRTKVHQYCNKL